MDAVGFVLLYEVAIYATCLIVDIIYMTGLIYWQKIKQRKRKLYERDAKKRTC